MIAEKSTFLFTKFAQVAEIGGDNGGLFPGGWLPDVLQNGAGQHECGQQGHDPPARQNRTGRRGGYQVISVKFLYILSYDLPNKLQVHQCFLLFFE